MLVKSIYIIFIITICFINADAQNLVPNPSFENYVDFSKFDDLNWHKVQTTDTPDYFNFSVENPSNSIYNKYMGNISPHSGDGFVGIFCYRNSSVRGIKNIREFIENKLITNLEKDSLYKIELSLRLDIESNLALKNFSVLFSKQSEYQSSNFKPFSQTLLVEFNSVWLDSTSNWVTLQALYKAQGNENYILLGNFKNDVHSQKKHVFYKKERKKRYKWDLLEKELASYYYIDDVKVEMIPAKHKKPDILQKDTFIQKPDSLFNIDQLEIDSAVVLRNINFEFNKSDLLPESFPELNKLQVLLKDNPGVRIMLEGHTDNVGGYDFNLKLSVERVESVVEYLINQGIDPGRMEYAGYSYSKPLVSNSTEEGRKKNRRVTFKIISK